MNKNNNQIRTMQDDIAEMQNKLDNSTAGSEIINREEKAEKQEVKTEDSEKESGKSESLKDREARELKSLITRVSKIIEKKETKESFDVSGKKPDTEIPPSLKEDKYKPFIKSTAQQKTELETAFQDSFSAASEIVSSRKTKSVPEKKDVIKKDFAASSPQPIPEKISSIPIHGNASVKSFWKDFAEKIRTEKDQEEIAEFKIDDSFKNLQEETGRQKEIKEKSEPEKTDVSGIIKPEITKEKEIMENKKKSQAEDRFEKSSYILPESRLILGRQEFYSSLKKKISDRKKGDELGELERITRKKQEIISEDEERRKLRKKIIRKYHINLYPISWKKVALFAASVFIAIAAAYYFLLMSATPPPVEILPEPKISARELGIFAGISNKIEIPKSKITAPGLWEKEAEKFFADNPWQSIVKLNIKDGEAIISFKEALESLKISNIPADFLNAAANDYNLFIFKSNTGVIRMGIAAQANNYPLLESAMKNWEKEKNKSQKMQTVFKPIFGSGYIENEALSAKPFAKTNYNGIDISYLHLPDKNNSLNYFFLQNNILVITPSKDSAFLMIDMANQSYFE